jgi:hypothetical protein
MSVEDENVKDDKVAVFVPEEEWLWGCDGKRQNP